METEPNFHYINTSGFAVSYNHGLSNIISASAYLGAIYYSFFDRIYFIPFNQGNQSQWHYLECNTGLWRSYPSLPAVDQAYNQGVYDFYNRRLYFMPFKQILQDNWHYIDEDTDGPVSYSHGGSGFQIGSYCGGAFASTLSRIYLAPCGQSMQTQWHFIDTLTPTPSVFAYSHNLAVGLAAGAYTGAIYAPTQDRVYLTPSAQSSSPLWHYIDCQLNGAVVAYNHGYSLSSNAYQGNPIYIPEWHRIYFAPGGGGNAEWHYLRVGCVCEAGYVEGLQGDVICTRNTPHLL